MHTPGTDVNPGQHIADLFERLDPADRPWRVCTQIADRIRDAVRSGRIGQGKQLPRLTALATYFEVAPATMFEALRLLADEGVVRTVRYHGTFACGTPEGQGEATAE